SEMRVMLMRHTMTGLSSRIRSTAWVANRMFSWSYWVIQILRASEAFVEAPVAHALSDTGLQRELSRTTRTETIQSPVLLRPCFRESPIRLDLVDESRFVDPTAVGCFTL